MVTTTTHDNDELPTHDIHGTDLRRVREMLSRGYAIGLIAECLGVDHYRARYAVTVATDDREGSPEPDEIWGSGVAEIQSGWTEEQAFLARRLMPRNSSAVVQRYRPGLVERQDDRLQRLSERISRGHIPVRQVVRWDGTKVWQVRVEVRWGVSRRTTCATFLTREEAEAHGREWLAKQHAKQAEAC